MIQIIMDMSLAIHLVKKRSKERMSTRKDIIFPNMMNKLAKYFIVVICMSIFPRPLSAQSDIPILSNIDTLCFEGELICRKTYKCDGNYRYYLTTKEPTRLIREIVYSDSTLRSRGFINIFPNVGYIRIEYNRDGSVSFSILGFHIEYKGENYHCTVNSFYDEKGNPDSYLVVHDSQNYLVVEYAYFNGNWKWNPHHNTNPPKYAKKLFRIFLSQYQKKQYLLEKCILFKP